MVEQQHDDFFNRNNLPIGILARCHSVAHDLYPHHTITLPEKQGYCSYTLILTNTLSPKQPPSTILQFKPPAYRINTALAAAAKRTYTHLAPSITELGILPLNSNNIVADKCLYIYAMSPIPGAPLSTLILTLTLPPPHRARLVADFARFLSLSWPVPATPSQTHLQTGLVGSSIGARLTQLAAQLPSAGLRLVASVCLARRTELSLLPVVLNHGDVVPSNVMVDAEGALGGLVDWAEAEFLPFGMCAYGLEYLLGHFDDKTERFVYVDEAEELRRLFWGVLEVRVPMLHARELRMAVRLARDVGVLLWFGFAFDEGRINRVVNEERDGRECILLRTFLGIDRARASL